jgi:hypothetical protein
MRRIAFIIATCGLIAGFALPTLAQIGATPAPPQPEGDNPISTLAGRLELEKYKATVKGLTQFGDRRQGTDRNRAAVDWIEAQLKSYGCPAERIKYEYQPPENQGRGAGRGRGANEAQGGGRLRGIRTRTGVNTDPMAQPDVKLRELNMQPTTPGPREMVYCTKVGSTHPEEMYIVGGHMDGHGWGEAANDDGSGTALVMELARLQQSGCADRAHDPVRALEQRNRSQGACAYIAQRGPLRKRTRRAPANIRSQVAQDDSARHDDVRPRHAARRRHDEQGTAARGRRQYRVQ